MVICPYLGQLCVLNSDNRRKDVGFLYTVDNGFKERELRRFFIDD